jgi:hypothetical protein
MEKIEEETARAREEKGIRRKRGIGSNSRQVK